MTKGKGDLTLAMAVHVILFHIHLGAMMQDAFEYGTILFDFVMAIFMTVPMAAWMLWRGHGRRHVAEMTLGMNAPVAVIIGLRLLGAEASLPWLADASHPAMFLGMLVAMLARPGHYTGKAGHSAHSG